ncbi:hypothetical protein JZ751_001328 [Albula glossodonta]|uniref:Uncharacterized protein n=1 Tax=Albula glossodonta TaxID=121402 RepID=A0A8T2PTB8_9TELE|nr:hypothetical protein JZ751_001328 [Albula glossodonta]
MGDHGQTQANLSVLLELSLFCSFPERVRERERERERERNAMCCMEICQDEQTAPFFPFSFCWKTTCFIEILCIMHLVKKFCGGQLIGGKQIEGVAPFPHWPREKGGAYVCVDDPKGSSSRVRTINCFNSGLRGLYRRKKD